MQLYSKHCTEVEKIYNPKNTRTDHDSNPPPEGCYAEAQCYLLARLTNLAQWNLQEVQKYRKFYIGRSVQIAGPWLVSAV